MNSHNILCICLPTCEPDVFNKYWLPSIDKLLDAKDILTIAINFQPPWCDKEITRVVNYIRTMGFKCVYAFNEYNIPSKGYIPFNMIRNDASILSPDSLFYVLTDDDFSYQGPSASAPKTAGEQYIDIVHYMLTYGNCGMTLIGGSMIRKIPKNHIAPVSMNTHITNLKGIVVRSMKNFGFNLFPEDSLNLYGAGEERVLAASRLANGLYIAKMGFGRTHHYEIQRKPDVKNGIEMYNWDTKEIIDSNVNKYIREKYGAKTGETLHDGLIIDPKLYFSNGGISEDELSKYYLSIDYSKVDSSYLIDEIRELVDTL